MNLLITAGATREPIDDVRYVSNVSTGTTGAALAEAFAHAGGRVTLLRGEGAVAARDVADSEVFSSASDLLARIRRRLASGDYDAVLMSAAVSDYRVATITLGKISSEPEQLTLPLVRNPKILPLLKSFSSRPLRVIGFKLTSGADEAARRAAVAAQFATGGVDAVVHNDLAELRAVSRDQHPFHLYSAAGTPAQTLAGAGALAAALVGLLGIEAGARLA